MMKRHQIMLEDWQIDLIVKKAKEFKKQKLSHSGVVRRMLCSYVMGGDLQMGTEEVDVSYEARKEAEKDRKIGKFKK